MPINVIEKDKNEIWITVKLFFFCYLLSLINSYFFVFLNNTIIHTNISNPIDSKPFIEQFFIAVIIAPPIETWLAQVLPNRLLTKLKISNKFILIIIPSILFGLGHIGYSLLYGIVMLNGGIILNYFYLESKLKTKNAFLLTALLHSVYNLTGLIF